MKNSKYNKKCLEAMLCGDFNHEESDLILQFYTCDELLQRCLELDEFHGAWGNVLMKEVTDNPFYPYADERERNATHP